MTGALRLGERATVLPPHTSFTFSCQLRPRERLADFSDRSRGVMKHEEKVLEKMRDIPQGREMPLGKLRRVRWKKKKKKHKGQRWKTRHIRADMNKKQEKKICLHTQSYYSQH